METALVFCPGCGNRGLKRSAYPHLDKESGTEYYFLECAECALEFCVPFVAATADHYENSEWYGDRWEFKEVLKYLSASDKRILELGCGEGYFGRYAASPDNDYLGIDFNAAAIEKARQSGISGRFKCIDAGAMAQTVTAEKPFDIILLFHVMEHLDNPAELVGLCKKGLAANGRLVFSVPSQRRLTVRLGSREWWDMPPHHLTRWNEKAIRCMLKNARFSACQIIYEPMDPKMSNRRIADYFAGQFPVRVGFSKVLYWIFTRVAKPVSALLCFINRKYSGLVTGDTVLVIAQAEP